MSWHGSVATVCLGMVVYAITVMLSNFRNCTYVTIIYQDTMRSLWN